MADRSTPLLAVLFDADNVSSRHAEPILKEVTSYGEPALRRVYADWSKPSLKGWVETSRKLGLVTYQESANTVGKNASDIGLVIDAMDILHSGRFDGFVLVSSDSDFTRLAARIREHGLEVIGIGMEKTPESLKNVCNRFVLIENIVDEPPPSPERGQPQAVSAAKKPVKDAIPLILRAMERIAQDNEWYTLGELGQHIQAEHPDFDSRSYGKRKLSDLIGELKRFEMRKEGNQTMVRRVD